MHRTPHPKAMPPTTLPDIPYVSYVTAPAMMRSEPEPIGKRRKAKYVVTNKLFFNVEQLSNRPMMMICTLTTNGRMRNALKMFKRPSTAITVIAVPTPTVPKAKTA